MAVVASATVFVYVPGSAIRPMEIPLYWLGLGIATACATLPMAVIAAVRDKRLWVGTATALLGLCPAFVGYECFWLFVELGGYTLKP